jgi:hypothetical protein
MLIVVHVGATDAHAGYLEQYLSRAGAWPGKVFQSQVMDTM